MRVRKWLRGWRVLSVLVVVLLAGAALPARAAVTIDFGTGVSIDPASPYQEDGFNVAGSLLFINGSLGNPARSIILDGFTPTLTISTISGDPFSLISFDRLCSDVCADAISVEGAVAGGGTAGPVALSTSPTWTPASGFAGFSNLTSLTLSRISGGSLIDNIELQVVPLPAALPLLATALAGLGLAGYRRRRATG